MRNDDASSGTPQVRPTTLDDVEETSGAVKQWRRRGDVWEGLVSQEIDGVVVTSWVPALVLTPND
ncbi:hypothetical protein [Nocardioides sp. MH1]|uniref:hypothetical protein n=1 Tax=Nocardioides sp. MH1 TaxID=3242490 RepID=UPI0035213621